MNLQTIIGYACLDEEFRESLFKDFAGAAEQNNFELTDAERAGLEQVTQGPCKVINKKLFETIRVACCPIPKCPLPGVQA
jgi:hypothetical protein